MFFTPTPQQLLHYLVLLYGPTVPYILPLTPTAALQILIYPLPATTYLSHLPPFQCVSWPLLQFHVPPPPLNFQHPEHPGCPALPLRRLLPPKPETYEPSHIG